MSRLITRTSWLGVILIIILVIFLSFLYILEIKKVENLVILSNKEIIKKMKKIPSEIDFNQTLKDKKTLSVPSTLTPNSFKEEEGSNFPSKDIVHLPILMYHHINYLPPNASRMLQNLTVTPEMFERQMEYLFKKNYHPITFKKFINYLDKREEIPEKSLIITFDDGWENQYQYAFPVLKKYNFQATFFIVTNYIGKSSNIMNWKDLKQLLENGMEIGSHTINHPNLSNLSESDLLNEIQDSKIILERKLGQKIIIFAYPYGAFNSEAIKIVKDNYLAACSTIEGIEQNLENMYLLKRFQVYNDFLHFKKIFNQ